MNNLFDNLPIMTYKTYTSLSFVYLGVFHTLEEVITAYETGLIISLIVEHVIINGYRTDLGLKEIINSMYAGHKLVSIYDLRELKQDVHIILMEIHR